MKDKEGNIIMCEDCSLREAKIEFAREPIFAITHRYGIQKICRQCYIEKIEKELVIINKNLSVQRKLLKKEELKEKKKK